MPGVLNNYTAYKGLLVELDSNGAATKARLYNYFDTYITDSISCSLGSNSLFTLSHSIR